MTLQLLKSAAVPMF